ncbi:type VI secretion system ATPase TssH [Candidatus Poribacteria bacterium]|nr:type VI secretion system ATPase TssH [Candidatus Poribacteria bacterium]
MLTKDTRDIKRLSQKLNNYTVNTLEAALGLCVNRGHYQVSIEHLLLKFLEDAKSDIPLILSHFDINPGELSRELNRSLEDFRSGNTGKPSWSPSLLQVFESAWTAVTLYHEQNKIRSGAILEAFLYMDSFQSEEYMDMLSEIRQDELRQDFMSIVADSVEDTQAQTITKTQEKTTTAQPEGDTALDRYTIDVTGRARAGGIDPARGRDKEIRQIIDILSRRRKNNPILVGEAGVGKTHVVEGISLRIVEGDVPDTLREVDIRGLDMGLLEAGAGVKGEFENRLKAVINEVKESPKPIVIFIDEAHMLIGAGGSAGTADAANMLKPELARGELRTIASTTFSEYKRYIEKDPALARRFQPVSIDEPTEENASIMLRSVKSKFELHHDIQISDEAITNAVKLSARYITGRHLPDKAVDLMDTAAARVKMEHTAKPAKLDDLERRIENINIEIAAKRRDMTLGLITDESVVAELENELKESQEQLKPLRERWKKETKIVKKIHSLQKQLMESESDDAKTELDNLRAKLREIQGDDPLVHVDVDANIAAQVVADWTGIPMGNMLKDEAKILLNFEDLMEERILGQFHAIKEMADVIRASKAGIGNPDAPIGVFLFAGPSGVGKTESSLALADLLFGGERFVTNINMSEYQESHTVSQLKGAPPGYVGYGEGGILTEAVRQRPYSVVVLDEVEKAHRDVLNLFYQVFDKGFMRDGEGREIDFKNTVIVMTGNLGWETIFHMSSGDKRPDPEEVVKAIMPELQRHFGVALLARCKVIPFLPLDKDTMKGIVRMKLHKIGNRLNKNHDMGFEYSDDMVDRIAERCTQMESGARNVDHIIDKTILPGISSILISQIAEDAMPSMLRLTMDEAGEFKYNFE